MKVYIYLLIYSVIFGIISLAQTKSVLRFIGSTLAFPLIALAITMYFSGFYYLFFRDYFELKEIFEKSFLNSWPFILVNINTYTAAIGSSLYLFLMGYFMYKKTGKLFETIYVTVFPAFILLIHLSLFPTGIP